MILFRLIQAARENRTPEQDAELQAIIKADIAKAAQQDRTQRARNAAAAKNADMRAFALEHYEAHKAAGTYRSKDEMADKLSDVLLPKRFPGRVIPTAKRVLEWLPKEGSLKSFVDR